MLEEEKVTNSTQHHPKEPEGAEKMDPIQPSPAQDTAQERHTAIKWIIRVGVLGATLIAMIDLGFFLQTRSWQMLLIVAGEALAIVCLISAHKLARRARFDSAGYWILLSLTIALGVVELSQSGITLYIAGGGTLTILLVGRLSMPRRWVIWLTVAGLFLTCVLLINRLEPLPRYDVVNLGTFRHLAPIFIILSMLAAFWQLLHTYQNIRTIRVRLPISFVSVMLVPVIAIGASVGVIGLQSGRQQVIAQLESVATLKEAEIQAWLDDLQNDLITAMTVQQVSVKIRALLEGESPDLTVDASLKTDFRNTLRQTKRFKELFLINRQGQVILSSERSQTSQAGADYSNEAVFKQGLEGPFIQAPKIDFPSPGQTSIIVARPIPNLQGQRIGIIAGLASLEDLNAVMRERAGLGETGETYLVGPDYTMLTESRFEGYTAGETYASTQGTSAALQNHLNGSGMYDDYRDVPIIGVYHWLPDLQVALLAEQDQSEAFHTTYSMLGIVGFVALGAVALAVGASLFVTRGISEPLANLTQTTAQIAAGKLTLNARVEQEDEIGALAQAFNNMTAQLRHTLEGLEQQVNERTHDLERRSTYLEASAEVGRAAASILEPDMLTRRAVEMVRERFDLYYVGLFLVDENREWAVLRAGTGEAGRAMLMRGHRIQVGEGMIGWSVANAQARVALEAGQDAVRLATAELPDTRSEAAIPLRSRGQVLGALTVQSEHPQAFDEDLLTALQIVADQMAVALDNARLFAESQAALETSRRAYGEISHEAWLQLLQARPDLGFRRNQHGISRITQAIQEQMSEPERQDGDPKETLIRSVRVRDHVIGAVNAHKSLDGDSWSAEEIKLLETLTDQLGLALEGARLYQETQRRALQERLTRQITDKVRAAPDISTIAQTAAEELVKALGGVRGFVKLDTNKSDDNERAES
jgi:GAF domain-containing protein/HAMP domain-containing protein